VLLGQQYNPEKADVWSVGMLVFEVLVSKIPYSTPGLQATTEAQLCNMILCHLTYLKRKLGLFVPLTPPHSSNTSTPPIPPSILSTAEHNLILSQPIHGFTQACTAAAA